MSLQHTDPDYSAAYVVIDTDCGLKGFGLTFTLGKGTEIGNSSVKIRTLHSSLLCLDAATIEMYQYNLTKENEQTRCVWRIVK